MVPPPGGAGLKGKPLSSDWDPLGAGGHPRRRGGDITPAARRKVARPMAQAQQTLEGQAEDDWPSGGGGGAAGGTRRAENVTDPRKVSCP